MVYPERVSEPVRPSMSRRQRRGALVAGGVGFALITLGTDVLGGLAIFAVVWFILATFFAGLFGDAYGNNDRFGEVGDLLAEFAVPLIISIVAAVIVLVFGFLISRWVLRAHGVHRPMGVTWAGFGVSMVAAGFVAGVFVSIGAAIAGAFSESTGVDPVYQFTVYGVLVAISVVVDAVLGALGWWWMAHVLRAKRNEVIGHG